MTGHRQAARPKDTLPSSTPRSSDFSIVASIPVARNFPNHTGREGTRTLGRGEVSVQQQSIATVSDSQFFASKPPNAAGLCCGGTWAVLNLSLIHISEPTRLGMISYAV